MNSKKNVERFKAFKLLNLLLEHNLLEKHGDEIVQVFEDTGNEIIADKLRPILPHWWREKKEIAKVIHQRKDTNGKLLLATLLDDLENTFDDIETLHTIALTGKAGTGKTETVIAFANDNEKKYKHIIWINCGEGKIRHELETLAKDLKIENLTVNISRLAENCFYKLSSANGKCLLIFDNADQSSNIQQVLPKESNFHTIVTYRKSIWETENEYGRIKSHELKEFEEDETLEFLRPILSENKIEFSEHQLRCIHKQLCGLPSAIQRLIAALQAGKISLKECTKKKQLMIVGILNSRERKTTVSCRQDTPSSIQTTNLKPGTGKLPDMWRLPQRNLQFIGRQDLLQKVFKHFSCGDQPLVLAACSGLGGVGKTQIALEFAWQNYEDYQGVIWFNAENKERLIEDYIQLGHALNLPLDKNKMEIEEQARYVIHWLENTARKGWLIIYDNAPIYGGEKGINGLIPVKGGKILITSRYSVGWPQSFSVEVFSREESKVLIEEVLHAEVSEEEKDSLAETLGDLPLALAQACAYINKLKLKISRYLQLYNTKKEQLLKDKTLSESDGTIPCDSSKPIVFITWDITMQAINGESLLAANWLICCAYLSPNDIPDFLLETFSENSENNPNSEIYEEALGILNSYSMLTCNEENHSSSIHRLVQEVIQLKEEKKGEDILDRWQSLYLTGEALLVCFPTGDDTNTGREIIQKLMPHLEVCLAYLQMCQHNVSNVSPELEKYIEKDLIRFFLLYLAEGCTRSCDAFKKREMLQRALTIYEKYYSLDSGKLATILMRLGDAYGNLGDAEKERDLQERALAINEKFYGADNPETAVNLVHLANAYGSLGDAQKKLDTLKRALTIFEKHYGPEHIQVAATLANLGVAYGFLGDEGKQRDILEQALTTFEKHYGPDHVQVADILINLGDAYEVLGDHEKQRDILKRALAIYEKHYGPEDITVATALTVLGYAHGSLGDQERKRDVLERALTIREKYYGPNHVKVAIILTSLGSAYDSLGDAEKGREILERALDINEKFYGLDHVEVAVTLTNLARAYDSLGDTEKQKEMVERALAIDEKFYGPEHIQLAVTLNCLGRTHLSLGNAGKGREVMERALTIEEKFYGSDHAKVAITLTNLGQAYESLGDIDNQREVLERVLTIKEKYCTDHVEVAGALENLGEAYGQCGDCERKCNLLERALAIKEKYYGPNHVEVAAILSKLGNAYHYNPLEDTKARDILERALVIQEKYYGAAHIEVAVTLTYLGITYGSLGDLGKGRDVLERALTINGNYYGRDHVRVAAILSYLGKTYTSLGDTEKGRDLLEQALTIQEKHYGVNHIEVSYSLTYLGIAYGCLGDTGKKRNMLQRALTLNEKYYGPDHTNTKQIRKLLNPFNEAIEEDLKSKGLLEFMTSLMEDNTLLLHTSASAGNFALVQSLVARGTDFLARHDHNTVLHQAVYGNSLEVVQFIISQIKAKLGHSEEDYQQAIDAKDCDGDTPLMWAAEKGQTEILRVLLEAGANINARNNDGKTALDWAKEGGHSITAELLMQHGAKSISSDIEVENK